MKVENESLPSVNGISCFRLSLFRPCLQNILSGFDEHKFKKRLKVHISVVK